MLNTDGFGRKTDITLVIKICKARDYCFLLLLIHFSLNKWYMFLMISISFCCVSLFNDLQSLNVNLVDVCVKHLFIFSRVPIPEFYQNAKFTRRNPYIHGCFAFHSKRKTVPFLFASAAFSNRNQ